jgi:glycine cleavage system aminomethyltransferase T
MTHSGDTVRVVFPETYAEISCKLEDFKTIYRLMRSPEFLHNPCLQLTVRKGDKFVSFGRSSVIINDASDITTIDFEGPDVYEMLNRIALEEYGTMQVDDCVVDVMRFEESSEW